MSPSAAPEPGNPVTMPETGAPPGLADALAYPFFQTVYDRKSRRVGLGMNVGSEILDYRSPYAPVPLSELEEALLCMAGTGLTGLNLGDLDPARGMGTLVQWTTRTWPSSCSNHGTELFFTNDEGTYLLNMFGLVPEPGEVATLSGRPVEDQVEWIVDLYRRARVELRPGRAPLPTTLPGLFDFNQWNANQPGTTLFIPVTNTTLEYINLLFIYLARSYAFSIVDEQHGKRSAGLQAALDSGRLDPKRQMGMVDLEQRVLSMLVVEQGFICQNVNLALQALGLGGWTFTGYLSRFVMGGGDVPGLGFRFAEATDGTPYPVGMDGVYEAFTPPYYPDMHAAVDAFMELKWSAFDEDVPKPYLEPDRVIQAIPRPHPDTVELVKDYCQYVFDTYGRFPAYIDPMYQRLTCQGQHVDPDFYERYYPPGALTQQHQRHFHRWHPDLCDHEGKPPLRD
ncbi:MAG: hypothetical protein ACLGG9_02835 [Thermoleophilia bacterium]